MKKIPLIAACAAATGALALAAIPPAHATTPKPVHELFAIYGYASNYEVDMPASHGKLVTSKIMYWDSTFHTDHFGAGQNIAELNSVLVKNTNHEKAACLASETVNGTDSDTNGSGSVNATHHHFSQSYHPTGTGQFATVCHQNHGPVVQWWFTYQDGSTARVYLIHAADVREINLVDAAPDAWAISDDGD